MNWATHGVQRMRQSTIGTSGAKIERIERMAIERMAVEGVALVQTALKDSWQMR